MTFPKSTRTGGRSPWLSPPDTPFSDAVRQAVRGIPLGRVVRYKDVAERIGYPTTAAPAVSRALRGLPSRGRGTYPGGESLHTG